MGRIPSRDRRRYLAFHQRDCQTYSMPGLWALLKSSLTSTRWTRLFFGLVLPHPEAPGRQIDQLALLWKRNVPGWPLWISLSSSVDPLVPHLDLPFQQAGVFLQSFNDLNQRYPGFPV